MRTAAFKELDITLLTLMLHHSPQAEQLPSKVKEIHNGQNDQEI